jgi:tetratricopeptide (TPR) repeat protein
VIAGYRGKMVFPGTEAFLPTSQPAYRSGAPDEPPDLSQSLSSLFDRFRRGDTTADENYWLAAGCVAADEAGLAREVILASRKRSLDDWRFDAVEAILAYRMNDLDAAREKLERAVANEPGSAEVHFNLAVVLHELGLETEAQQHRIRALELANGTALGTREL